MKETIIEDVVFTIITIAYIFAWVSFFIFGFWTGLKILVVVCIFSFVYGTIKDKK